VAPSRVIDSLFLARCHRIGVCAGFNVQQHGRSSSVNRVNASRLETQLQLLRGCVMV